MVRSSPPACRRRRAADGGKATEVGRFSTGLRQSRDCYLSYTVWLSEPNHAQLRRGPMPTLQAMLAARPHLLADGATGTNLFDMGLTSGDAPELWNEEHPERIAALHQEFRRCRRRHHPHQFVRRHPPPAEAAQGRGPRSRAQPAGPPRLARDGRRRGRPPGGRGRLGRPDRRAARAARRADRRGGGRRSSPSRSRASRPAAPTSPGSRPCRRRRRCAPPPGRHPWSACPTLSPPPSTPPAAP